jgi:phage terminase large subunit-like protein
MEIHFKNGSKILFSGLDDANRIERLFGMEYLTVWINEVSEIKSFAPVVSTLIFRLRQKATIEGTSEQASKKFIFDCNPPTRAHFAYKRFEKGLNEEGNPLANPGDWRSIMLNTKDNIENVGQDYIDQMRENLSLRDQRRMIDGEFLDDTEGSLFPGEIIDKNRHKLPDDDPVAATLEIESVRSTLTRVVIAVDPAITNHKRSDLTGIVVAGINEIGHAYVLEDATMKGSPQQWADRVSTLFEKWGASLIVAEDNQGGLMVEHTLRSGRYHNLPIKLINARDGKVPRAQPVSLPYEKGEVHHVGFFRELEEQMEGFTLNFNPSKDKSPDRLDALVHALTELLITNKKGPVAVVQTTARLW